MPATTYTTSSASRLVGISKPAVRTYAARYRQFLSPLATPDPGQERRFTDDDLRLLHFIYAHTTGTVKETHDEVAARLAAGELDTYEWAPETPEPGAAGPETAQAATSALVTAADVKALQQLLDEARRREEEAQQRADALQARVDQMLQELGEARGKLAERPGRYIAPAWWRALFGGRPES